MRQTDKETEREKEKQKKSSEFEITAPKTQRIPIFRLPLSIPLPKLLKYLSFDETNTYTNKN